MLRYFLFTYLWLFAFSNISLPDTRVPDSNKAYKLKKITLADKAFGLSVLWKETGTYVTLENKELAKKWDDIYRNYLDKTLNSLTIFYYYRELQEFTALLHDGQTKVIFPDFISKQLSFPPVRVTNIENRAIVSNIARKWQQRIPVGSEILSVSGYPTRNYISDFVLPYINSGSKEIRWNKAIGGDQKEGIGLLLGPTGAYFRLKIRTPSGQVHEYRIKRIKQDDEVDWVVTPEKSTFKWMNNGIGYANLTSLSAKEKNSESIQGIMSNFSKAKGIILDLRDRNNKNDLAELNLLKNIQVLTKSIPCVILTGFRTPGSVAGYVSEIQKRKKIVVLGTSMSEITGRTKKIMMPGNGYAFVQAMRSNQLKDLQPDILIKPKVIDLIKGIDPVMNRAIEMLRTKGD